MDDIERAIDDGVNTYKAPTKDKRLVPGGGATEMELAKHVREYGEVTTVKLVTFRNLNLAQS